MAHTHEDDLRGQMTLDFAIAMGVFLLTVAFVFTFIPSLTAPFVDGTQSDTATADRVASHLVEGSLADPNVPYVLEVGCTVAFFEELNDPSVDDCGYTNQSGDFKTRIGVADRQNIHVSIVRDGETTCLDANGDVGTSNCIVTFEIGDDSSNARSTTIARRVASIDELDVTVLVEVW